MKNKGYSLLECILALALSFILIGTLLEVCGTAYHLLLKERVLYATAMQALELARVLRTDLSQTQGVSCAWQHAPFIKLVTSDQHHLTVQHVDSEHAHSVILINPSQLEIQGEIKEHNFLISDCSNAEFVQIEAYTTNNANVIKAMLTTPLKYTYKHTAKLYPWVVHHYSLQENSRGNLALYLKNDAQANEWLSRVNEMSVVYHSHYVQLDFKLGTQAMQILAAYRALL